MPDEPNKPVGIASRITELSRADAGYVILAVALTDQKLETLILAYMPNLSDANAKMLFSSRGPLGRLAHKMDYAYALGLIEDQTYEDLKVLNQLRNTFAHPRGFLHFNSPDVEKVFKMFVGWRSGCDTKALFDEVVSRAVRGMSAKTDELVYAQTIRPGTSG